MEIAYYKDYSPALGREMEIQSYGSTGKPVLFIPCQDGRFYDFENFHMTDVWRPWIDSGRVTVYSIDTIDKETYSDAYTDPRVRAERHEAWVHYITDEVVPFIRYMTEQRNGEFAEEGILIFGCSLGATHAANLYFRFPDLFDRCLALSGIYTASYGFGDYMDDIVYNNSPVHYLANMPEDHPYIEIYNKNKGVICVGQGPWEIPDSTRWLDDILKSKGINVWVDYWGYDCAHDWDWWYKQVVYFLPYLVDEAHEE